MTTVFLILFGFLLQLTSSAVDPVRVISTVGDEIVIPCGKPMETNSVVQWRKVGSILSFDQWLTFINKQHKGRISMTVEGFLNFTHVKKSDEGTYECQVMFHSYDNKEQNILNTIYLEVKGPAQYSIRIIATVGNTAILPCHKPTESDSSQITIVQWQKEEDIVPIYVDSNGWPAHISKRYEGRVSMTEDGSLNLTELRKSDEGIYECHIFAVQKQNNVERILLEVKDTTKVASRVNVFRKKVGKTAKLPCHVKVDDRSKVTYRWLHNNSELETLNKSKNRHMLLSDGSLVIFELKSKDSGNFTCIVLREGHEPLSETIRLKVY